MEENKQPEAQEEVLEAEVLEDAVAEEADAAVAEAERVIAAEAEAAAMRDKYLRLQAEWDNYRKRVAQEAADNKVLAAEKIMRDLIQVVDDMERAIAHAQVAGEAGLLEGVVAINSKLTSALTKHGLTAIDPAGQAFDELKHQAVATIPDDSVPDETVNQVFQKGYELGSKVIRPAMVTITTGGPKREVEE